MNAPGPSARRSSTWLALLLTGALTALLHAPCFQLEELDNEEGRRAIPAREMIESGDYVLPTVWKRPYLAKPPLLYWTIAAVGRWSGGVDEGATRLPSVLATILTAMGLAAFGAGVGRPRAGWIAACLFAVSLAAMEKAALGEIEALFSAALFGSVALLWRGGEGGGKIAPVLSGLFLAAAILAKGPPALVFFGAGLAGVVATRGWPSLLRAHTWGPLAIGLAVALVWVLLLFDHPGSQDALDVWANEMGRTSSDSAWDYLGDRLRFVVGVAGAFLPASLVLLLGLGRERPRTEPWERFATWTLLVALGVFLVYPGTRPRYAYPSLPWACALAGAAADRLLAAPSGGGARRLLRASWGFYVLGGLGVLAAGVSLARPLFGFQGLDALGLVLVAALGAATVLGIRATRAGRLAPALAACLALVALVRLVQVTQVVPHAAGHRGRRVEAHQLEELLPPGEVLVHVRAGYNVLFYVDRPLRAIRDPATAPPGSVLLLKAATLDGTPGLRERGVVLGSATLEKLGKLVVLRIAGPG